MNLQEARKEDFYASIANPGEGIYKEKGSKFLGFAFRANSVEEAEEHVAALKARFHDARHHCYAYRINPEKPEVRMNDDGEPSNTAGAPIFNQLLSNDLWNTIVIVVRYFGGTKLGASGLSTAYKEAAREAISASKISEDFITRQLEVRYPYPLTNEVMRIIKEYEAQMLEEKMAEDAGYLLSIRKNRYDIFLDELKRLHEVRIV